jgi:hypothetical protein
VGQASGLPVKGASGPVSPLQNLACSQRILTFKDSSEAEPQTVGQASGLPVKGASGPVSRLQNLACLQRILRFKDSSEAEPQTVGQASGLPVKGASGPVSRLQNLACLQRILTFKDSSEAGPQTVGQASGLPVKGASGPVSPLQNLACSQRILTFKESCVAPSRHPRTTQSPARSSSEFKSGLVVQAPTSPGGTAENSPRFQPWVRAPYPRKSRRDGRSNATPIPKLPTRRTVSLSSMTWTPAILNAVSTGGCPDRKAAG